MVTIVEGGWGTKEHPKPKRPLSASIKNFLFGLFNGGRNHPCFFEHLLNSEYPEHQSEAAADESYTPTREQFRKIVFEAEWSGPACIFLARPDFPKDAEFIEELVEFVVERQHHQDDKRGYILRNFSQRQDIPLTSEQIGRLVGKYYRSYTERAAAFDFISKRKDIDFTPHIDAIIDFDDREYFKALMENDSIKLSKTQLVQMLDQWKALQSRVYFHPYQIEEMQALFSMREKSFFIENKTRDASSRRTPSL